MPCMRRVRRQRRTTWLAAARFCGRSPSWTASRWRVAPSRSAWTFSGGRSNPRTVRSREGRGGGIDCRREGAGIEEILRVQGDDGRLRGPRRGGSIRPDQSCSHGAPECGINRWSPAHHRTHRGRASGGGRSRRGSRWHGRDVLTSLTEFTSISVSGVGGSSARPVRLPIHDCECGRDLVPLRCTSYPDLHAASS